MHTRRSLLALVGGSATAGCMSLLPGREERGFSLGEIWVTNGHDAERALSLRIQREDEVIYDRVLELGVDPGANKVEVEPTWTAEPAVYTLTYHRPGTEESTFELTAEDDRSEGGDCMFVHISFHPGVEVPGHSMSPASEHPWPVECP